LCGGGCCLFGGCCDDASHKTCSDTTHFRVQGEITRIQTKGRASTPIESAKEESDRHETRDRKFEIQTMHLVAGIHEKRPITKNRNQQVQKRHQQIQQNVGQTEKVRSH
tara:strand:+ start:501 stop:827 length:327 start_codon:yes stop_codon:yes gene_type:complete